MTVAWSTATFDLFDRADALRETVRDHLVPVELRLPERPSEVFAEVEISQAGPLQVSTVHANPATVHRLPSQAKEDAEPWVFVSVQATGTSMIVQDGRHTVIGPGQIGLYDTTRPYTLLFEEGVHTHFLRVPRDDLALSPRLLTGAVARPLGGPGTTGGLASSFIAAMASSQVTDTPIGAAATAAAAVALLRGVVAEVGTEDRTVREARHETLFLRVIDYLERHLADPGLTPDQVARAHHVSRRHLYNVLAGQGICFGDWIRARRLDRCREELAANPSTTVAEAAVHWGFGSADRFGRTFRAVYGTSPTAWRALSRLADGEPR
ncbi:helix-turn-helix domain-containing protein [Streptomyces sp. TLI_171]|uniref:AraC-like ligand-binding domain-containing protein n=1 Tax=Streptomyces sp. TLI_171 TaxID=1938859 RepID=UPI000E72356C|nr:helix-turn-helix domain-containing protein [Streptomyces sp. TLI_171]RKE22133.1 AraC-like DNA-binding protein [Streptomyces sp. TLI_171]